MAFDALGLYLEDMAESEYPARTNPKMIIFVSLIMEVLMDMVTN